MNENLGALHLLNIVLNSNLVMLHSGKLVGKYVMVRCDKLIFGQLTDYVKQHVSQTRSSNVFKKQVRHSSSKSVISHLWLHLITHRRTMFPQQPFQVQWQRDSGLIRIQAGRTFRTCLNSFSLIICLLHYRLY